MKVRFTVEAAGQSYQVTRPVRQGVAVEEERNARAFARKLRSDRHSVRTELLSRRSDP